MTRSELELKKLYDEIKQGDFQLIAALVKFEKNLNKIYLQFFHNEEIRELCKEGAELARELKERLYGKCYTKNKTDKRVVYRLVDANSETHG